MDVTLKLRLETVREIERISVCPITTLALGIALFILHISIG
jgi:hypothetical protein